MFCHNGMIFWQPNTRRCGSVFFAVSFLLGMLKDEVQHIKILFYCFGCVFSVDAVDVLLYLCRLNRLNLPFSKVRDQMPFDRRKVGIPVCVGLDIGHLIELQTTNCPFFKGDCFCFFRLAQEQVEFIRFSVFFCFAFRITLGFRAVERFADQVAVYILSQRNFVFITFFRGQIILLLSLSLREMEAHLPLVNTRC